MTQTIDFKKLTPEQKQQLYADAIAEKENAKEQQKKNREAYKDMVHDSVPDMFHKLVCQNDSLQDTKKAIFEAARDLIELKVEAYDVKEGQQSHTFSSEDGKKVITIGYRVTDAWDDTLQPGIDKVNQFTASLVKDEDTQNLVNTINRLLRKDANGNLKSSRVLELQAIADDYKSPLLDDAIDIIRKAYKPNKSCWFIEANYTDGTGKKHNLPLSISTVDFPEGTEIDFM